MRHSSTCSSPAELQLLVVMQIDNALRTVEVIVIMPILCEGAWLLELPQTNALRWLPLPRDLRLARRRSSAEPQVPNTALWLPVQLGSLQHLLRDLSLWSIRHRMSLQYATVLSILAGAE